MAKSSIVSRPSRAAYGSRSTSHPSVGSTPNSVRCPCGSRNGDAEKRMPQPLVSSEEKGMPEPPPVVAPTTVTPGKHFITDTKLLAAEKVERLHSTTTGFPHIMRPAGAGSK